MALLDTQKRARTFGPTIKLLIGRTHTLPIMEELAIASVWESARFALQ